MTRGELCLCLGGVSRVCVSRRYILAISCMFISEWNFFSVQCENYPESVICEAEGGV